MSSTQPERVLKFEIKSLDPSQATIESVPAAEALTSELQEIVYTRFPGVTVKIRRAEGIPGLREVQELLLHLDWQTMKTAAEATAAGFVTKEFLKLMKAKLRNVFVKQVPAPGDSSARAKKKKARKTGSGTRRGKKKSGSSRKERKR